MANQTGVDRQRPQAKATRARGAEAPAAPDEVYGIVSVLYHSLQGAQACRKYLTDAEEAGADEVAEFFRDCLKEETARAQRAKGLLLEELEEQENDDEDHDEEV